MSKPKCKKRSREKKSGIRRKRKVKNKKLKNKRRIGFKQAVSLIKKHVLGGKPNTVGDAIKIALKSAKSMEKKYNQLA